MLKNLDRYLPARNTVFGRRFYLTLVGSVGDLLAEMRGSVAFTGLWMDDSISVRSLLPFQKLKYINANQSDNQTRPNLSDSELQRISFPFPLRHELRLRD